MGSTTLSTRDVRAVLDLAGVCAELPAQVQVDDLADAVPELLGALAGLVRCDLLFWDRFQLEPEFCGQSVLGPGETGMVVNFDADTWLAHLPEHPIMSGRYGPVVAFSDVLGTLEFRRSWHYLECFRPNGSFYEIGLALPRQGVQRSVISFNRKRGRDFTDRDHLVLQLIRPHVHAALQRLGRPVPQLTARQLEIMRLVAQGLTNGQIAHRLGTAEKTVGKHLENTYERLGAHSRVHAIALCDPLLRG